MLYDIKDCSTRAAKIVRNMFSFSRKSETHYDRNHLEEVLDRTIEPAWNDYDLKRQYDFRKIQITRRYATDMPAVFCDGNQIQQVLLNLIKNAAEAMAPDLWQNCPLRGVSDMELQIMKT